MNRTTWTVLAACIITALAIVMFGGEAGAVPMVIRQDTSDDCQLIFQASERWQESNGTAGLQTTGDNPDTHRGPATNERIDCNIPECERDNPCVITVNTEQPGGRGNWNWKFFCTCRQRGTHCQGVTTGSTPNNPRGNENQGARGEYHCEGICGGPERCGDNKIQETRTVTSTAGNTYHVTVTKRCVCPDP